MQKAISLASMVVLLLAVNLVGCSTRVGSTAAEKYNQNPLTVAIPAGLSGEQIESVMKETLTGRGWQVEKASPQQADGTLNHRSFNAKVSLVASDGLIRILTDSRYVGENADGAQPGVPMGWLDNLQKDLTKRLAAAARQP